MHQPVFVFAFCTAKHLNRRCRCYRVNGHRRVPMSPISHSRIWAAILSSSSRLWMVFPLSLGLSGSVCVMDVPFSCGLPRRMGALKNRTYNADADVVHAFDAECAAGFCFVAASVR